MTTINKLYEVRVEKLTKLGDAKPGDYVRLETMRPFEDAMVRPHENFFMVIETQPKKAGRVTLSSIDGKLVVEKDDDRMVVVHPATLNIGPAI